MPDLDSGGLRVSPDFVARSSRAALHSVLRRTVEGELLPRLLLQHRSGPVPPTLLARVDAVHPGELNRFIDLLRQPDELLAEGFVWDRVEAGASHRSVFEDLLAPAANRLGTLWEDDTCDFVEVTLACARLQRTVRRLSAFHRARRSTPRRGRALVCGVEGDQHTLGAVLVAEVLAQEGYAVILGAPFEPDPRIGAFDLVAISVARVDRWPETRERVRRARTRHSGARVIVGGGGVQRDPAGAATVGADGSAVDFDGLLHLLRGAAEARS